MCVSCVAVNSHFLDSLSGDDEFHACIGIDCGNMPFSSTTTIFGNNSWRYECYAVYFFKHGDDLFRSLGKCGMCSSSQTFHPCSIAFMRCIVYY